MARFDEESSFTQDIWRRVAWIAFCLMCLFGGQLIADWAGTEVEPFKLPVLVGFGSGIAIVFFEKKFFPSGTGSADPDLDDNHRYVDNLWWKRLLNSTWFIILIIVGVSGVLLSRMYPQARQAAFEGRFGSAFMLGFMVSITLVACLSVARDLLRKRVSS